MKQDIIDFLEQSNWIEGVTDGKSLDQAVYAWKYLMKVKNLSPHDILKAHKILMLHQKLLPNEKGYFRTVPVWIGNREGMTWTAIRQNIDLWVNNVNDLIQNGKNESKYLERIVQAQHIGFEKIHPFIDGNGRIGRMLMNWTRLKCGLPILVIEEKNKQDYYEWFS